VCVLLAATLSVPSLAAAQISSGGSASPGAGLPGLAPSRPQVAIDLPRYRVVPFEAPAGHVSVYGLTIDAQGVATGYAVGDGEPTTLVPARVAADGTVTLLPSPTGDQSVAWAGNAGGLAVGYAAAETEWGTTGHFPFAWVGGGARALAAPPGTMGEALAVNDDGLIVGAIGSQDPMPIQPLSACAWDGATGAAVILPKPAGEDSTTVARAVNALGHVAGWAVFEAGEGHHAVRWDAVDAAPLVLDGSTGAWSSQAWGLNALGDVAGSLYFDGDDRVAAFLYGEAAGAAHELPTLPGWDHARAGGVDAAGRVVGLAWNGSTAMAGGPRSALLWKDGAVVAFDALLDASDAALYEIRRAWMINDAGQVVADARRLSDDVFLGVRLDPLPAGR
jgi:uncharacterized membrane protein